jgi:hypothetical protein
VVPKEKIHANMFVGSDSKYKALPWNKMQRQKHNRVFFLIDIDQDGTRT